MIYAITFVVAFCSLTYEFIIAQTLAAVFGGTLFQYALTIGVFTFAMGIGSLMVARVKNPSWGALFRVELALSLVGAVAGWWVIAMDPLKIPWVSPVIAEIFALIPGFAVGFLTGLELPLLMILASSARISTRVLAVDYAGMFIASLTFPLLLLPYMGVWGASVLVAAVNAVVGVIILAKVKPKFIWWWTQSTVVAALALAWLNLEALEALSVRWFNGI